MAIADVLAFKNIVFEHVKTLRMAIKNDHSNLHVKFTLASLNCLGIMVFNENSRWRPPPC